MNTHDASYIAGFVDADGCITLRATSTGNPNRNRAQYSFTPRMEITNKSKHVMEWIISVTNFNNKLIQFYLPKLQHRQRNPYYRMYFTGINLRNILPEIEPYLQIKRKQANYLFKIFNIFDEVKSTGSNFRLRSKVHNDNVDNYLYLWFKVACLNNGCGLATEMLFRKFDKKPEELLESL